MAKKSFKSEKEWNLWQEKSSSERIKLRKKEDKKRRDQGDFDWGYGDVVEGIADFGSFFEPLEKYVAPFKTIDTISDISDRNWGRIRNRNSY